MVKVHVGAVTGNAIFSIAEIVPKILTIPEHNVSPNIMMVSQAQEMIVIRTVERSMIQIP